MWFKKSKDETTLFLKTFIQKEVLGGAFLILATIAALFAANSALQPFYDAFWNAHIDFRFENYTPTVSVKYVVDEILMTLFFLLIGCELKREALEGELSALSQVRLPLLAALGGMVVPALFYTLVFFALPSTGQNPATESALRGWAIPTATDIAFALGVLGLLGSRLPPSLKVFLMALAVIDDLGAIVLIGLFYTGQIDPLGLSATALVLGLLWTLNKKSIRGLTPYLLLGPVLWITLHKAGVHATLSGVLLAAFIPLRASSNPEEKRSPLKSLENALHPFVAYVVMPLFALANAGVSVTDVSYKTFSNPITLGILVGLFFGKPIGVLSASWLAIKMKWANLPSNASWKHLSGVACLCGIGFTMSLFIGVLAFESSSSLAAVRLGVLTASGLSACLGCGLLFLKTTNKA